MIEVIEIIEVIEVIEIIEVIEVIEVIENQHHKPTAEWQLCIMNYALCINQRSATVYMPRHLAEMAKSLALIPVRMMAVATPASHFTTAGVSI